MEQDEIYSLCSVMLGKSGGGGMWVLWRNCWDPFIVSWLIELYSSKIKIFTKGEQEAREQESRINEYLHKRRIDI